MSRHIRSIGAILTWLALNLTTAAPGATQEWPARPVHLVVGLPAGNAPDIIARLITQRLSQRLGRQIVVENKPGADSNIGAEYAVRSAADGYTLLMVTVSSVMNTTLYKNLNFNLIRDMAPVASIGRTSFAIVVNPSLPVNTLPELIAYAKANPGKINMASPGVGSGPHIFGALCGIDAGIELVHVPYRGSFISDLLGGQVQLAFIPISLAIGNIRTDRLRVLAVTSARRLDVLPDVPAANEFVPGYEAAGLNGIGAPKGTPIAIIEKLNREISAIVLEHDTKARLAQLGVDSAAMSPSEFGRLIVAETDKWAKVIQTAGIKAE